MEGIGSYCILKGENSFCGGRKVQELNPLVGDLKLLATGDGRNFAIGQHLQLTAVSQSSGIIDGLIWS